MFVIKKAAFIGTYYEITPAKLKYPVIVFAGKSNCGKSSLINNLTLNRKLARTSSTPGKTRTINYYLINDCLLFVDLPGYGYRVSRKYDNFEEVIEKFLNLNLNFLLLFHLIDIRRQPDREEELLREYLYPYFQKIIVILTKADKLNKSEVKNKVNYYQQEFHQDVLSFSIKFKELRLNLLENIKIVLAKTNLKVK